ncbi:MAG TPA: hypothetical protein P5179_00295 [Candidatus Latescibacteria bacterium]|nr:hypothetical protein [Candidatus Latescibacterota bacterium]HRS93691.1 hypothetical protein [Candidatus Latescibacterota bacterium]
MTRGLIHGFSLLGRDSVEKRELRVEMVAAQRDVIDRFRRPAYID